MSWVECLVLDGERVVKNESQNSGMDQKSKVVRNQKALGVAKDRSEKMSTKKIENSKTVNPIQVGLLKWYLVLDGERVVKNESQNSGMDQKSKVVRN